MQFSAQSDVEAPFEAVFAALSDFDGWERAAMRRGAQVGRTDAVPGSGIGSNIGAGSGAGPGTAWQTRFVFRGKDRRFDIKLVLLDPAGKMAFTGLGTMLEGEMQLDAVTLGPRRTRMVMAVDVRPRSIGARLLLQTMKLGRGRVQGKLNARLATLARDIEARQATLPGAV